MSARYVVEHRYDGPPVCKPGRSLVTYWYGPDHGFGTTSGSLADGKRFTSRDHAERALRSVYGSLAQAGRQGYGVIREPATSGER